MEGGRLATRVKLSERFSTEQLAASGKYVLDSRSRGLHLQVLLAVHFKRISSERLSGVCPLGRLHRFIWLGRRCGG